MIGCSNGRQLRNFKIQLVKHAGGTFLLEIHLDIIGPSSSNDRYFQYEGVNQDAK